MAYVMPYDRIFLDTSVFIAQVRGDAKRKSTALEILASGAEIHTSAIVVYEVLVGERRKDRIADWRDQFAQCIVHAVTEQVAIRASRLGVEMRQRGLQIGFADLLIGSSASLYHLPLATYNKKDFERIPQLDLVPFR